MEPIPDSCTEGGRDRGDDHFNLIDAAWIPVLYRTGRFERVGIRRALVESGSIRQIAASNPMDNVALLRFLLAVVMWCRPGLSEADRPLRDGAGGIPENWLENLGTVQVPNSAFNLLGDQPRFYQDASLKGKEPRPIADLLVEFPGADSVNHMRHVVHDGSYGFCPACCALGILRLSVWAPANRFYPASVNPASAAYAISDKASLLATLFANLPQVEQGNELTDEAPWLIQSPPKSPGVVANLAWRPRNLWLNDASKHGSCANCGIYGELIASVCNEGGWPTPTTAGRTKKFWEADRLLLRDAEPISLPGLAATSAAHSSRFWRAAARVRGARTGNVVAIGPVVNKFVFQDATSVVLPGASAEARAALSEMCSYEKLRGLLKRTTPNPDRQHPEVNAALVLLTPDTEAKIRTALCAAVVQADNTAFLSDLYRPVVEQVIAFTARGSPLRRREALARARSALDQALNKITASQNAAPAEDEPAGADSPRPAKTRRTRRKKGDAA